MSPLRKEANFWKWFVDHEEILFGFDPDDELSRERLFDELQAELHKVNPGLTFVFSPHGHAQREFVISADGARDVFPSVVSLFKAAPSLERWRITAFRPRQTPLMSMEIYGKQIDPNDLQFTLLDNGRKAGIRLFIPGYQENEFIWKQIGSLMLDQALGEFDVEMRLGLIKFCAPETSTDGTRHPLSELPARFDQLVTRLEGRNPQPS